MSAKWKYNSVLVSAICFGAVSCIGTQSASRQFALEVWSEKATMSLDEALAIATDVFDNELRLYHKEQAGEAEHVFELDEYKRTFEPTIWDGRPVLVVDFFFVVPKQDPTERIILLHHGFPIQCTVYVHGDSGETRLLAM